MINQSTPDNFGRIIKSTQNPILLEKDQKYNYFNSKIPVMLFLHLVGSVETSNIESTYVLTGS